MTNSGKVKFFRNKERNVKAAQHQPYVPNYQVLGVEPQEFKSAVVPTGVPKAIPSVNNPRLPRPTIRQPYATPPTTFLGRGRDVIPNVGNNVEHTWSGVDGEIIDDVSLEPDHPMVDNNEFVTSAALTSPEPHSFLNQQQFSQEDEEAVQEPSELLDVLESLEVSSYLLLVKGVPICSGPIEEIEDQVQALVFGDHELCDGEPVQEVDIMVFKKLNVKVGVTLE